MNVLLVEDELHTAELLQETIEQDSDFIVVEKLESILDAVTYLSKHQHQLDLLFFDIQLADGYSFEIFRHVDVTVPVIFCTAYDEYAMEAIKNNGIEYVLKPIQEKEIHEALRKYKRLRGKLQSPSQSLNIKIPSPEIYQQNFLAQYREKTLLIRTEDVALFEVQNDTVYLCTFEGKKYSIFKKLEYVESVCDPQQFFRINRQMLVNHKAVISFQSYFNRKIALELKIKTEETPVVSRLKVTSFKEWLINVNS